MLRVFLDSNRGLIKQKMHWNKPNQSSWMIDALRVLLYISFCTVFELNVSMDCVAANQSQMVNVSWFFPLCRIISIMENYSCMFFLSGESSGFFLSQSHVCSCLVRCLLTDFRTSGFIWISKLSERNVITRQAKPPSARTQSHAMPAKRAALLPNTTYEIMVIFDLGWKFCLQQ